MGAGNLDAEFTGGRLGMACDGKGGGAMGSSSSWGRLVDVFIRVGSAGNRGRGLRERGRANGLACTQCLQVY